MILLEGGRFGVFVYFVVVPEPERVLADPGYLEGVFEGEYALVVELFAIEDDTVLLPGPAQILFSSLVDAGSSTIGGELKSDITVGDGSVEYPVAKNLLFVFPAPFEREGKESEEDEKRGVVFHCCRERLRRQGCRT